MYRLFQRFLNIFKAKAEKTLDSIENPTEMMNLAEIEFEQAIKKSTKALAELMADLSLKKKSLEQFTLESQKWFTNAKNAKNKGDVELAQQALSQKSISDTKVQEYSAIVQHLEVNVENVKKLLDSHKLKLEQTKAKNSIYKAKFESSKAQQHIAESLGGLNDNALSNLNKYTEQIDKLEAKSNALTELTSFNTKLEDEFRKLEIDSSVSEDMLKLDQAIEEEKNKKLLDKVNNIMPKSNSPKHVIIPIDNKNEKQKQIEKFLNG
jgi:phage shock protein A